MKILYSSAESLAQQLKVYLAPGGMIIHSAQDGLLDSVKLEKPSAIILLPDEVNIDVLLAVRFASPSSFIIVAGSDLPSDWLKELFNHNCIHFFLDERNIDSESDLLKHSFWSHYFVRRKIDQTENRTEYFFARIKFLHEITIKMLENKPLGRLLDEIMLASQHVLDAEKSSFMLYDPKDGLLHFHVLEGASENIIKDRPLELGSGIAGWVAKHRIAQLVDDCYTDKRFNPNFDKISNFRTRNMVCAPIIKNDMLLGVISVLNKRGDSKFLVEDVQLLETLAGQCAVAIENARLLDSKIENEAIKKELEMAFKIQQKLLPSELPVFESLAVSAKLIPAQEVGGDYYSVHRLSENRCLLMVADVSGKGIPAALLVSTIDATLHTIIKLKGDDLDPKFIAETINSVLCDVTTSEKFATAWIGILDMNSGILKSINAGHNEPILFKSSNSSIIRLRKGGIFLGVVPFDYEVETLEFSKDDIIVFFSDGVVEAMDTRLNLYSDKKLVELVQQNSHLSSGELVDMIVKDVLHHEENTQQSDDITICIAKGL